MTTKIWVSIEDGGNGGREKGHKGPPKWGLDRPFSGLVWTADRMSYMEMAPSDSRASSLRRRSPSIIMKNKRATRPPLSLTVNISWPPLVLILVGIIDLEREERAMPLCSNGMLHREKKERKCCRYPMASDATVTVLYWPLSPITESMELRQNEGLVWDKPVVWRLLHLSVRTLVILLVWLVWLPMYKILIPFIWMTWKI